MHEDLYKNLRTHIVNDNMIYDIDASYLTSSILCMGICQFFSKRFIPTSICAIILLFYYYSFLFSHVSFPSSFSAFIHFYFWRSHKTPHFECSDVVVHTSLYHHWNGENAFFSTQCCNIKKRKKIKELK